MGIPASKVSGIVVWATTSRKRNSPGLPHHGDHADLAALAVEQRLPEGVEADETPHRFRDLLVDPLERERGPGERGDLVDDLEPDGALPQPPDVLEGVAELAGKARRQRLPGE